MLELLEDVVVLLVLVLLVLVLVLLVLVLEVLALKLVVATGVHAFPNRTASDRQHPSWVLALPNFVKVASANINGMVVKI